MRGLLTRGSNYRDLTGKKIGVLDTDRLWKVVAYEWRFDCIFYYH